MAVPSDTTRPSHEVESTICHDKQIHNKVAISRTGTDVE